jgi:hypothetical protein
LVKLMRRIDAADHVFQLIQNRTGLCQQRGRVIGRLLALLEPGVRYDPRAELLNPAGRIGPQRQCLGELHALPSSSSLFTPGALAEHLLGHHEPSE